MSDAIEPIWRNMLTALDAEVRPHSNIAALQACQALLSA